LTDDSELTALKTFLYEFCRELDIVAYVRPQHEFAISMFSTNLKNGSRQKVILQDLTQNKGMARKCDYAGVLNFWEDHFPAAKFKVRKFGRSELVNGDSVSDFSHVTGIRDQGLIKPERRNESLSWKAQLFTMKLNGQMDHIPKKMRSKNRAHIFRALEKHFSGTGIMPGRTETRAFFEHFSESNERLRKRYFSDSKTLFDVSFDKYPEENKKYKLTINDAFEIFAKILPDLKS